MISFSFLYMAHRCYFALPKMKKLEKITAQQGWLYHWYLLYKHHEESIFIVSAVTGVLCSLAAVRLLKLLR